LEVPRQLPGQRVFFIINTVSLRTDVHVSTIMQSTTRGEKSSRKNVPNVKDEREYIWYVHLRLLSLRGSSRVRTRSSCFSLIPRFVGSVTRTSRTVGLDPLPNPRNASTPRFSVSDGAGARAGWGRDITPDTVRLRSTAPCRPPFAREDTADGPEPSDRTVEGLIPAVLARGVGMTRCFGMWRGLRLEDVRDDEVDEPDSACPARRAFIAAND